MIALYKYNDSTAEKKFMGNKKLTFTEISKYVSLQQIFALWVMYT